jgi:hypothetical protein
MAHIVFSKTNISKATCFELEEIGSITIKDRNHAEVVVWNNKNESDRITVKQSEILPIMEKDRLLRSQEIDIIPSEKNGYYLAVNPFKQTEYKLFPYLTHIYCECHDYKNQTIWLDRNDVCCEHIFALLTFLGYSSLTKFLGKYQLK